MLNVTYFIVLGSFKDEILKKRIMRYTNLRGVDWILNYSSHEAFDSLDTFLLNILSENGNYIELGIMNSSRKITSIKNNYSKDYSFNRISLHQLFNFSTKVKMQIHALMNEGNNYDT